MVRRFHTQHGPAVFLWCEAQANIEAPRRICGAATNRCRSDALKEPIHKKRANSFATIGGQHSNAQFRRSLVYESVPWIGCRKESQPGCAYWNALNQREQTPIRRFAFPSPRRIWQWPDRREPIVEGAIGPEAQTGQGTAFLARVARLMPSAWRSSQFTPRFSGKKWTFRNSPYHARLSSFPWPPNVYDRGADTRHSSP